MCGIVGYVGSEPNLSHIIEGLSKLEYRGYDSSGLAFLTNEKQLICFKTVGGVEDLIKTIGNSPLDGTIGLGHTRWATHGVASEVNAHPHLDCKGNIAIIHNGIVENYNTIKQILLKEGHIFRSQTDTEVVAHLLESLLEKSNSFHEAIVSFVNQLEGAFSLVCLMKNIPDTLLVIRKRSPMCIGLGNGEMFVASDQLAFANKTNKVLFVPDESFALVKKDGVELYNMLGKSLEAKFEPQIFKSVDIEKGGFSHFMLKEIYEQKRVIYETVKYVRELDIESTGILNSKIDQLEVINLIGCGTSCHAGQIARYFFEKIAQIPTRVSLASEFRYAPFFKEKNSLFIMISQSGETADTLEALRLIRANNLFTLALANVASSNLVREADAFFLTKAGPEIAVASTKAFTAQLSALFWLANFFALQKNLITKEQLLKAEEDLLISAEVLENSLESYKQKIISVDAPKYSQAKHLIFLGRNISYPMALEAALKVKEIAYIFVDCYPAGELKHGPLALVEKDLPIFLFSCLDDLVYQKLVSNAQEVKARLGHLVVFAFEGQEELINLADVAYVLPKVNQFLAPIAMAGLTQFFSYQLGLVLNRTIDKPRNLAKSVTVE